MTTNKFKKNQVFVKKILLLFQETARFNYLARLKTN